MPFKFIHKLLNAIAKFIVNIHMYHGMYICFIFINEMMRSTTDLKQEGDKHRIARGHDLVRLTSMLLTNKVT